MNKVEMKTRETSTQLLDVLEDGGHLRPVLSMFGPKIDKHLGIAFY
jgi:nitric oxide synthase oxygenase domain/subunit